MTEISKWYIIFVALILKLQWKIDAVTPLKLVINASLLVFGRGLAFIFCCVLYFTNMTNSTNNRGRTFWDLIAEHPKIIYTIIILLIVLVAFLAVNQYSIKSPVLSLEPDKRNSNSNSLYGDTEKIVRVTTLDTSVNIQKKLIPNSKAKTPQEQIVIRDPNKDTIKTEIVNITSHNQSGGITANQVNIGSVPRNLDINNQSQLLSFLNSKDEMIDINSIMGDAESFKFANQINDFLKSQGFKKVHGVNQSVFDKPVVGQFMDRDKSGVKILIGSNPKK